MNDYATVTAHLRQLILNCTSVDSAQCHARELASALLLVEQAFTEQTRRQLLLAKPA